VEKTVDFAAVARVAKHAELKSIRLIGITGTCEPKVLGELVPDVQLECKPGSIEEDAMEVICEYTFTAHSEGVQVVYSTITYLLVYEISGGESPTQEDFAEFARANGTLNSWPFVREVLFGLTSRMGYPPYTLPLMHFGTKAKTVKRKTGETAPVAE
jgi:preprotein translocase subunit SecB